jgi:hypothetical protein
MRYCLGIGKGGETDPLANCCSDVINSSPTACEILDNRLQCGDGELNLDELRIVTMI